MKLKGITDVFFDLDHTLWDFDKNSALTFKKVFELNELAVDLNAFLANYIVINAHYWKRYRDEKIDHETLRFGRLNDTFKAVGFSIEDETVYRVSRDYIMHLTNYNHLFDNTIIILDYLSRKYTLHIISNGLSEVQHKKLRNANIYHYFKTVTNAEIAGVKKPNPKIFEFALQAANTNINQSVMVGDGYEADILGAMNVGMDVIYFDPKNQALDVNIKQINNLIQLKKYL
ncbi:YjjG family noncanonical pyrimidine nucleotidase [Snuella sedimenti]|uniref:YjjG family noncanonical pyrimidine nucleotidase n=1 Tax=Snuella sedimenti TaxID=2798802 RepID=A0A8J7LRV3_9FLAO|nr:YjjG family noncanonical pyrimidine nucleotidase [Snuella sedimenti]MBJ6366846.1 YjjG family noncanonical pyrimidine nucleotidase [Snuella sedimenti]